MSSSNPAGQPNADKFAHLFQQASAKPAYVRSVSPRLRILLYVVFTLFAVLSANGLYLAAVTALEYWRGQTYQDRFYQFMFLVHLGLGLALILPVVVFGTFHMLAARHRRNRRAVRVGYALFGIALAILVSGVLLMRFEGLEINEPTKRSLIYWAHVLTPLAAIWLYWLHRLAGPRIKWAVGGKIALGSAVLIAASVLLTMHDPTGQGASPKDGDRYFQPSLARTADGKFIPARALMNDAYCMECHKDIYDGWFHSAHHISSFNNPAYLASIRETRQVSMERDGNVQATRFCAGCHDPVPFFTGAFDDPKFDDVKHPTAHAGITCTACHAIEQVGSTRGNADFVIKEPKHYPFVYSDNPVLAWLNRTMVKAKPAFHKQEMLKPFHKSAEFCSTCHKVNLPGELTKYKEFLRGQNHYDSFLLSGVSGHGARSFYYPEKAQESCNGCHMPGQLSDDPSAEFDSALGDLAVKGHLFPGANTAVPFWRDADDVVKKHQAFLKDSLRVDLFGLREDGEVEGTLHAPLRPTLPELVPGDTYLLEAVIRTLKVGHHFTQGTVDSNEVWLEVVARSGSRIIGISGQLDEQREVDPWSHFVNVFMLDRTGKRIDRRNAQDIFTPLYNHQLPPGAGQTVHYRFTVPPDVTEPVELQVKLNYRKFDKQYVDYIARQLKEGDLPLRGEQAGEPYLNPLPITVIAEDSVVLPVRGGAAVAEQKRDIPDWQRWNDYGIGLLLKGKAELKQAAEAFAEVERLGKPDGAVNQARVMFVEGDLDGATAALRRAQDSSTPAPPWVAAYFSGLIDRQQGNLESAEANLRGVLATKLPERGFDFSRDYMVRNDLGQVLIDLAQQAEALGHADDAKARYEQAREEFLQVLAEDSEDFTAHANLTQVYEALEDAEQAELHRQAHLRYKPDENAAEIAVPAARKRYPAANQSAEDLVIYDLLPPGVEPVGRASSPVEEAPRQPEPRATTAVGTTEEHVQSSQDS